MSVSVREILAGSHLFSGVEGDSLERLVAMAQLRRYAKGRSILREGDPCPGIYVVGSGMVRVFKMAPSGKEHILHFAGPGMTFAEVAAIGRFNCPASAEAMEPTTCVLLPGGLFNQALESDHDLCLQLMTGMALWVRKLVGLMEDIVLRDAGGRVARYLLDIGGRQGEVLTLPNLKKDLASHLNLTSETLSRTLRRLSDAGLIEPPAGARIRIVDREQLQQIADGLFPAL